jgi:hypothetical protein
MNAPSTVAKRNAIEALRAGVPNRAAIRLLGSDEGALRQDFLGRLGQCDAALRNGEQVEGIILEGGFGAGKSHLLGYFAELAQQEKFVVSQVPISKETPLFDPARLYAAMVRAAVVPDANDDLMTAVISRLHPNSDPHDALESWTTGEVRGGRLSPLFAALLYLIPKLQPDDHARIARFFGGARLNVTIAKGWLRAAGATKLFDLKPVREADLVLQRLRFAPRLLRAAGFYGWCVLLDEVELIGRYSPLQRGRSYAELARWLGLDRDAAIPGVVTVAAVTDDFQDFLNGKRDGELIPPRLEDRGMQLQSAMAKRGIERLERRQPRLSQPTEATLRRSLDKIAGLYHELYDWVPPEIAIAQLTTSGSMRQHVKSWITTWDIERLYGQTPQIETGTIATDYSENSDIEKAPVEAGEDDADG